MYENKRRGNEYIARANITGHIKDKLNWYKYACPTVSKNAYTIK